MNNFSTTAQKVICLKGTKEILRTLEEGDCTWTDLLNTCNDAVSLRIFNIRLRQLEDLGFIGANAAIEGRKAVKIYFLTEKGKKLSSLIEEAGKLDTKSFS